MSSPNAGKWEWRFPFVDIMFYDENVTHMWPIDTHEHVKYHLRQNVYPLHSRPFSSLLLPAPNDTRAFLKEKFDKFTCKNSFWNHAQEKFQKQKSANCYSLAEVYPYVLRNASDKDGFTNEVLMVGNRTVQTVTVREQYTFQKTSNLFEL